MQVLLFTHSVMRWLVLGSLGWSFYKAYVAYTNNKPFTKTLNKLRHWTATVAHIQLMIGIILYSQSQTVKALFAGLSGNGHITDPVFFGVIHITLMLLAVVLVTLGSAMAKRKSSDSEKSKTMYIWFGVALLVIFVAIPWPFSPLAQRPYIRPL
ncbi:hypothetical protein [Mucilaginibacter aquatilis]|uniref:Cytochrome B n=1 Tax=Mucilaginibacter aquatilis TaxID=1517760 RepID=A0A6I4I4W3_9SPHI|nr:hypothetical protein [Mucilaginibacter aquatilis]MVN89817.1 hypothetical protein [Mucilaginibacter aquatilis]